MTTEILLLISNSLTAIASFFMGRRRSNAETDNQVLRNLELSISLYKNIIDDLKEEIHSLNIKIQDTQCGFKLYKSNIGKLLFSRITRNGYEHDIEISIIAQNKKILIKELPVTWVHKEGSKVNILIDSIKVFLSIVMLKIRY